MLKKAITQRSELTYDKPNKDGNVWPRQKCPGFTPRKEAVEGVKECWYCAYADFHLNKARVLEVGVCNWPEKTTSLIVKQREEQLV